MTSEYALNALSMMTLLFLLAIPSFFARAGWGRRWLWFGVSAGFLLVFVATKHWRPEILRYFGLYTEDFVLATALSPFCLLAALSFAAAGCLYKLPRNKLLPGKILAPRGSFRG